MRNARFWEFVNGDWVKITLRPGSSQSHASFAYTDEGWHSSTVIWQHDGETVICQMYDDQSDCDGRYASSVICECPVGELAGREAYPEEGFRVPNWQKVESSQRDFMAEMAGY